MKALIEALKTQANDARRAIIKDPEQGRGSKTKVKKLGDLHMLAAEILEKSRQPTIEEKWSETDKAANEDPVLGKLQGESKETVRNMRKLLLGYMPGPDLFNTYFHLNGNGTLPTYKTNEEIRVALKKKEAGWDQLYLKMNNLLRLVNDTRKIINNAYGDSKPPGTAVQLLDRSQQVANLVYKLLPTDDERPEQVDVAIAEEALKVLKEGKPIDYFIDIWSRDYIGKKHYGKSLLFSMLCSSCNNSMGLNPAADGKSGTGKSFAMQAMINLNHQNFRIIGMITPKALMYSVTRRGTTVFLDDVGQMPPELAQVIKIGCTYYQDGFEHMTVVNQESSLKNFPKCINWWITGVDVGSFDVQILNRNINIALDEKNKKLKKLMQKDVHKHQRQDAISGRPAFQVTREVLVCREICRQLLEADPVNVVIPWLNDPDLPDDDGAYIMAWSGEDNPRNFLILADMIKVSASVHRYQRPMVNGSVVATLDDYDNAAAVFNEVSREQTTKLTKTDQAILEALKALKANTEPVDLYQLSDHMKTSYKTVYGWMNGRPKDGVAGFLDRAESLVTTDELTETEYDQEIERTDMGMEREKTTGSKSKRRIRIRLITEDDPLSRTTGVFGMTDDKRKRAIEIIERYVKNGGLLINPDDPPAGVEVDDTKINAADSGASADAGTDGSDTKVT